LGGQLVATMRAMAWHWKAVEGCWTRTTVHTPVVKPTRRRIETGFAEHQMLLMAVAVAPTSSH
jgi:hypothetical protein